MMASIASLSANIVRSFRLRTLRAWLPGVALARVIGLAASGVSALHGGPTLLYALFFGIAFHYLSE